MHALLQLTLDLFGADSAQAFEEKVPPAHEQRAQPAIEMIAPVPAPTVVHDAASAFIHPRASRETGLDGTRVAYELLRGQRRTIGFLVGAEGLTVRAPRWVALRDVDAALQEKAGWIVRKLGEARERQVALEAARIDWRDGARFDFLGGTVAVRLDPPGRGGVALLEAEPVVDGVRTLSLALGPGATAAQIRDAVRTWLMRQARRRFIERLDHFAPLLGVQWRQLSLSNAGTRWGSASADGAIRLHWRLVQFSPAVLDYVVVHELSHLRVMDHSPRFWATVQSVMPDYAELRRQLKDALLPRW